MRRLISCALLLLAAAQMAVAEVDAQDEPLDEAGYAARMLVLIDSLIQSQDPAQQAAGLLMSEHAVWAGWHTEESILSGTEFFDRLYALIDTADTPLARALLAQLCASNHIRSDCVRRGLDDAIVRHDGAELLARLQITERDDTERARSIIFAAQTLKERQMDFALLLLDAMEDQGDFAAPEFASVPLVYGLTLMPHFTPFSDLCGLPSAEDTELNQACERTQDLMMKARFSMLLNSLGSAVSARRLEAQGDSDAQERHEQWRARFTGQMACFAASNEGVWETADAQFMREFLEHWQKHGEASAWSMIGEKAGLECESVDPPPFRSASVN